MSKDKISDYSATANSNTDIAGINIDEGCAPSGINNAIRTLMKQLKDFQQGTNSDSFNGPVGSTTPAAGTFTSLSDSGNLTFTGTGNRITGDFSNATVANRVAFQTSTANSNTNILAIPNGTGVASGWNAFNNPDPTNASYIRIIANSSSYTALESGITGTGTYLPMTFYTGGSERVRIGASGGIKWLQQNEGAFAAGEWSRNASWGTYYKAPASGTTADIAFVSQNGTIGWKISNDGAGYTSNIGSGGTVTQATSKSTGVTINKPTGQITTNNAALGAGATAAFVVSNSIVAGADSACIHINSGAASAASYRVGITNFSSGAFIIFITNVSAGSLSEALVLNFAIIKGATS